MPLDELDDDLKCQKHPAGSESTFVTLHPAPAWNQEEATRRMGEAFCPFNVRALAGRLE